MALASVMWFSVASCRVSCHLVQALLHLVDSFYDLFLLKEDYLPEFENEALGEVVKDGCHFVEKRLGRMAVCDVV